MNTRARPSPAAATVRPATVSDAERIHALIESYSRLGKLLPRSKAEILRRIRDFFVIDRRGEVLGCGALEVFSRELGEIRSLVIDERHRGEGLGRLLAEHLIAEARRLGLTRMMALTYVPEFFHNLGFETVPKSALPEKVWGVCIKCYKYEQCDEIAVHRHI
jgi:amino-acid N-acetyltransferase